MSTPLSAAVAPALATPAHAFGQGGPADFRRSLVQLAEAGVGGRAEATPVEVMPPAADHPGASAQPQISMAPASAEAAAAPEAEPPAARLAVFAPSMPVISLVSTQALFG